MRLRPVFLFALALSACTYIHASDSDIRTVAWQMAARNKSVAAAKANYEAELEGLRAANVLAGPEADFDYKFNHTEPGENRWGLSVGQPFDWPGVYSARSKANGYRADAFRYLYQAELADAAYEAMQALIRLAASAEQLELLKAAVENTKSKSESIEYAYSRGEVTVLDFKKMQLELFSLRSRAARAEAEHESLKAAVAALNGGSMPADLPSLPADAVVGAIDAYADAYAAFNPSLSANRSLASALGAEVSAARRSALPSFKLSYTHDFEEGMHFNGFGVSVSLPSWGPSSSVKLAKATAKAAELQTEDYNLRLDADLRACHARALVLNKRVDQARAAFTGDDYTMLLARALEKGKITVIDYFNEYNNYLEAAADYVDLKAEFALAMAYLNRYTAPER